MGKIEHTRTLKKVYHYKQHKNIGFINISSKNDDCGCRWCIAYSADIIQWRITAEKYSDDVITYCAWYMLG